MPKYPRQMSELQPIPTTGRTSVCSPDHSSLEDVQRGQHYQCQITSCSQSDCCAKFKLGGQPEKYKLPFCSWYQCQYGRCGTQVTTCAPLWCAQPAATYIHINASTPHVACEWDKWVQNAINNSIKNVYVQKVLLNLHRQPWHILISWGWFCCPHNLILKRLLCVTNADLPVCRRGY